MSRTVSKLKDGLAGYLTGTSVKNVTNVNGAIERGLRNLLGKISVPEASTADNITLYDGVYDYSSPSTIFGGALRDLRPIGVSRNPNDFVYRQPIEQFDRTKAMLPNGYAVTFETVNGVNLMRVANVRATKRITLDTMTATTGWTSGGLSPITVVADQSFYYTSPASLRFTLTGSASQYVEKTLPSGLDLTSYQGVGVAFLAFQMPTGSTANLTSIELRLGSDSSNYYAVTATQGFLGAWTAGDFILVAFDLAGATTTGSPTITAMDYVRLTFAHTATMTNCRIGNLFLALPSPHKLYYETTAVFSHSGTLSNSITDDNDVIMLGEATYNLFEAEAAMAVALQQGGSMSDGVCKNIYDTLNGRPNNPDDKGLYGIYRGLNPSEELRQVGSWYE